MGVRIVRGPLFIIEKRVIVGCDCSGAVLIAHGKAEQHLDGFSEGWLKELCIDILGKDTFWWWRYNYGFNQGRALELFREDKDSSGKKRLTYYEDEVSKSAVRFAKKLGLFCYSRQVYCSMEEL